VRKFHHIMGGVVDPHAAYLLLRGLKTLELRVQRHNSRCVAGVGSLLGGVLPRVEVAGLHCSSLALAVPEAV